MFRCCSSQGCMSCSHLEWSTSCDASSSRSNSTSNSVL
jgi:hypothetical protein